MTIERLAQYTAEPRVLTDIVYYHFPVTLSTAYAKTGSYSYELDWQRGPFGLPLTSGIDSMRMGFWFLMTEAEVNNTCFLYQAGNGLGSTNGISRINLRIDTGSGNITLIRPSGSSAVETLDTVTIPAQFATLETWFHVGITHQIHEETGYLSIYVDGNRIMEYVGDTRPARWNGSSIEYATSMSRILGPGAASASGTQGFEHSFLDDMFIDSTIGEADAPVPARRFGVKLVTDDGADDDWTSEPTADNYANVDDNPNDGDATYNKALAADLRDTYQYSSFSLPADHRIIAAIPLAFAKRLDTELDHQISLHVWDGSNYEDSPDLDLSMSFDVPVFARFTTQPDASDWNETDLNLAQFGVRSRGTF